MPRVASLVRWLRPRVLWRRFRLRGMSREEAFTYILERQMWDASESVSGSGSTLEATESIRVELPEVLSTLGARSLLDAPCGDYHWMSRVELDIDRYVGGEIVQQLVDQLSASYADDRHSFVHLDITRDPLPAADAFLCRDCFLHLSNADVARVLDNARRSSCRYLLGSTYPDCEFNADIPTGLSRPLNLCRPPFSLPPPMRVVSDPGLHGDSKCLGVWDLELLRTTARSAG